MHLTTSQIMTHDGQNLPLQRDLRDALSTYARLTWPRDTAKHAARSWGLADTTARNLLKGHASDATITTVLRAGGWALTVSVMGAVLGESLDTFIITERERIARDQRATAARADRLSAMARDLGSVVGLGAGRPRDLARQPLERRRPRRG